MIITKQYLQELQQQREFVEARWQKHVGLPAIRKLQLYQPKSGGHASFKAVDVSEDRKTVLVVETCLCREFGRFAIEEVLLKHFVPVRYLSMTDEQVLAERQETEDTLDALRAHEKQRKRFEQRDKYSWWDPRDGDDDLPYDDTQD